VSKRPTVFLFDLSRQLDTINTTMRSWGRRKKNLPKIRHKENEMENTPELKCKVQFRLRNLIPPLLSPMFIAGGFYNISVGSMQTTVAGVGLLWAGVALLITFCVRD
jgi:hypothetical protein